VRACVRACVSVHVCVVPACMHILCFCGGGEGGWVGGAFQADVSSKGDVSLHDRGDYRNLSFPLSPGSAVNNA